MSEDVTLVDRVRDAFGRGANSRVLDGSSEVNRFNKKFYTAGLRGGSMYGPAAFSGNVKIGIELRDTTRDLNSLEMYLKKISGSISKSRWKEVSEKTIEPSNRVRLTSGKVTSLKLLGDVIGKNMANYVYSLVDTAALPLTRFEDGEYFNYINGRFEQPTELQRLRIIQGRNQYSLTLKNLEIELKTLRARSEKFDEQDVAMAIKMSLAEWAKLARASELYQNF